MVAVLHTPAPVPPAAPVVVTPPPAPPADLPRPTPYVFGTLPRWALTAPVDRAEVAAEVVRSDPATVQALINQLRDDCGVRNFRGVRNQFPERDRARTALLKIGGPAIPALLRALKEDRAAGPKAIREDPDLALRVRRVEQMLGEFQRVPADAVPGLIPYLSDPDPDVRGEAAILIGRAGPSAASAVPALRSLLKAYPWQVRFHAAEALGRIGSPARACAPELIGLLADENGNLRWTVAEVRARAARAPAAFGPCAAEAVPGLLRLLEDSSTQDLAAIALARIGRPAAPDLARLLDEARGATADLIAWALGEIGPEAAEGVPDLVRLLDTGRPFYARYVLAKIGPAAAPAVPRLLPLLKNRNVPDRTDPTLVINEATGYHLQSHATLRPSGTRCHC